MKKVDFLKNGLIKTVGELKKRSTARSLFARARTDRWRFALLNSSLAAAFGGTGLCVGAYDVQHLARCRLDIHLARCRFDIHLARCRLT